MKTCCVYHSIDLDGWMSAAIVKHWYNEHIRVGKFTALDSIEFIGYNYGQPIPDLSGYDKIIMVDISFPKEEMLKIKDKLVWIDHHISAIKQFGKDIDVDSKPISIIDMNDLPEGLLNIEFAACELTWQYFFPKEPMPEIVRLLGRYDCFGHKGTDEEQKVLEFQYGARQVISNYENAYNYLIIDIASKSSPSPLVTNILYRGYAIYQYLCTEAKQSYKNGFDIYFRYSPEIPEHLALGFTEDVIYKFICINKERFNPVNFGIDYHKDGYDGAACFHYANGMWNFSLYNDNREVDCSVIAKQFGGGGHAGAAGFRINDISQIIK